MSGNQKMATPVIQRTNEIMSEMLQAADTLEKIGLAISVFGSARIAPESPYYTVGEEIGKQLAQSGFVVIAGGGPGLMEAANKGCFEAGGTSVGLHIKLKREAKSNSYLSIDLPFQHFLSRKATFFMHSTAYVVLPGGFGTLDELFEALTLIQTGKVPPGPVILVGKSFWGGMFDWIREQLLGLELINPIDPDLFFIEDDPVKIVDHLKEFYRTHPDLAKQVGNKPI